jgi:hypothetical protein
MSSQKLYEEAKIRVKSRKKFYSHIVTWVIMSVFFILINLFTTDYFWAIFPILAWGIGVAFHGIQVFSDEWEDQQIEREYDRLKRKTMDFHGEEIEDAPEDFRNLRKEWKDQDFV